MPKEILLLLGVMMAFVAGLVVGVDRRLQRLLFCLLVLSTMRINPDVQLAFMEDVRHRGTVWGFRYTVTDLMALVLLVGLVIRSLRQAGGFRWWPRGSFALWTLIAASALSIVNAGYPLASLFELNNLLLGFLLFVAVVNFVRTEDDLRFVMIVLLVALTIPALDGFRQHFQFLWGQRYMDRVRGPTPHPNLLSMYLNVLLPLCLVLALTTRRTLLRLALVGVALFTVASVMFTLSRGGLAGLAVGCFSTFVLWFIYSGARAKAVKVMVLLMLFTPIGVKWAPLLIERFTSREAGASMRGRAQMTDTSLATWREHPWVGIGTNNYALEQGTANVHNSYLLFLAETGVFGLAAFLFVLLTFLFIAARNIARAPPGSLARLLSIALTAGLAALVLQLYGEFAIRSEPIHYLFHVLAGITVGTRQMLIRRAAEAAAARVPAARRRPRRPAPARVA